MKKYIEKLQFITHDLPNYPHVEQAQVACEAGAKWIQYRCLSKTDAELLNDIKAIASICDDWGATLIVTEHVHLAGQADIQGFHLEDMAADFFALREELGDAYTLGGSSNSIENLIRLAEDGADYAGFGPFKPTITKPNDFPLLGLEGYMQAVDILSSREIDLPILAVGGITLADVRPLIQTGIYGIAVSSAINQSENLYEAYQSFYQQMKD